jgi:hypothetical protein
MASPRSLESLAPDAPLNTLLSSRSPEIIEAVAGIQSNMLSTHPLTALGSETESRRREQREDEIDAFINSVSAG